MAGMGHEDAFPPPSLSGRCRLGEATFAGMGGKEEDAPKPAVCGTAMEPLESTHCRPSSLRYRLVGSAVTRTFAPDFYT
jgi:hypothetical protein